MDRTGEWNWQRIERELAGWHRGPEVEELYRRTRNELGYPEPMLVAAVLETIRAEREKQASSPRCFTGDLFYHAITILMANRNPRLQYSEDRSAPAVGPGIAIYRIAHERNVRVANLARRADISNFDEHLHDAFHDYVDDIERYHAGLSTDRRMIDRIHAHALDPLPGLVRGQIEEHLAFELSDRGSTTHFRDYPRLLAMIESWVISRVPFPSRPAPAYRARIVQVLCDEHGFCPTCAEGAIALAQTNPRPNLTDD